MLLPGTLAPDFELNCTPDQKLKLSELRGKKIILAFYPADWSPVCKLYGVYDEKEGESQRALYVLDEEGIIRWNYLSPVGINPGADGILDALEELNTVKRSTYDTINTTHQQ